METNVERVYGIFKLSIDRVLADNEIKQKVVTITVSFVYLGSFLHLDMFSKDPAWELIQLYCIIITMTQCGNRLAFL